MKTGQRETSLETKNRMDAPPETNELIDSLNGLLANQYVVFTKTLNFHWNLIGLQFYSLHTLLGEQYRQILEMMDDLAERIRFLGGQPVGTVHDLAQMATLSEKSSSFDIQHVLKGLSDAHENVDRELQGLFEIEELTRDRVSEDLIIQLQRNHQKMIWMLRSHLEKSPGPASLHS